ncbi:MAG TPA: zinc ribbon domain-containing protein [Terracidiphilus sp.]|jgi:flagellar basal body-associated protein FliL
MSNFCGTCGSPLADGQKFCGKCGVANSAVQQTAPLTEPPASASAPAAYAPVASSQAVITPAPTPARSNALLKVAIAAVVVLFVGGVAALGAVYYVVHKVKEKAEAVSKQALGENSASSGGGLTSLLQKAASSTTSDDSDGFKGDPCRFLSKEDVSRAVGVEIVRAQAQDAGCSYIAKGDPADMVSKHMTSMVTSQAKSNGTQPTADQTKMMQQITGAFFKQQEASDKNLSKQAATGEVLILSVSFSTRNAELEMKMNRAAFNHITGGNADGKTTDQKATGDLDGIGDDAYEMGGSSLIFRKGGTVVHMMFPQCPCDANAIKPLAANVATQL